MSHKELNILVLMCLWQCWNSYLLQRISNVFSDLAEAVSKWQRKLRLKWAKNPFLQLREQHAENWEYPQGLEGKRWLLSNSKSVWAKNLIVLLIKINFISKSPFLMLKLWKGNRQLIRQSLYFTNNPSECSQKKIFLFSGFSPPFLHLVQRYEDKRSISQLVSGLFSASIQFAQAPPFTPDLSKYLPSSLKTFC